VIDFVAQSDRRRTGVIPPTDLTSASLAIRLGRMPASTTPSGDVSAARVSLAAEPRVNVSAFISDMATNFEAGRAGLAESPVAQSAFRDAQQLGNLAQSENVVDSLV
jgi:hypothetical protein